MPNKMSSEEIAQELTNIASDAFFADSDTYISETGYVALHLAANHEKLIADKQLIESPVKCIECTNWSRTSASRTKGYCKCLSHYHDAAKPFTEENHFCGYGIRKDGTTK
jgi:ankyrin repeat protein